MVKFKILSFSFILICSMNWAQAANQCFPLFINNKTNTIIEPNHKTEVQSLETLGKAMTEGMLLHPEQADIFEIYRQVFFGDPKTSLNGQNLKTVTEILKKYPDLIKKHFREFEIRAIEKVYKTPETLDRFIRSQITTAGQIRNNLFQIEANISFWKKILDYKDPLMPESLKPLNLGKESTEQERARARVINEARAEFQEKAQKRFIKYLNRIISKSNRDLLADLSNDHVVYEQKAKALFETLRYVESWMSQKGRDTRAIRQAMLDLVFTVGYGNRSTMTLLKSNNAIDKVQGLNQLWNDADAISEVLKYPGHFAELKAKLNIEYPTGLSKNEDFVRIIQEFEKDVLNSPYTIMPTEEVVRIRSLSIQESPFRSCLGADCSSRTYFDKALDPNYIYFTMTDASYKSNGQATLVLGTATNKQTGQKEQVAFLDKLQNIPTQKLELFLNALNQSLQENGYKLAIPTDLGRNIPGHGGLSNMDVITDFVQLSIMPRLSEVRAEFTPHPHNYQFSNSYSRGDQKLEVRIFEAKPLEVEGEIRPGKQYQPYTADKALDKTTLAKDFLKLRDSTKEEDQIKFIKSGNMIGSLERLGLYSKSEFITDLKSILNNKENSFNLRKNAFYELIFSDSSYLDKHDENFTPSEFKLLVSEINQWKNSNDSLKKTTIERIYANILKQFSEFCTSNDLKSLQSILRSPFFSVSAKDNYGNTALMLAVRYDSKDTVEFLLKQPSIDVNAKNTYGNTALIVAGGNGSKDSVELLLKHPSIDVNAKNTYGNTALMQAIWNGFKDPVELLLKHPSIDVNAKDKDGNTALVIAAKYGYKDAVELLLKHPSIDVNAKDKDGDTALMWWIAKHGSKDVLELLLKQPSIDVNAKNTYGNTALMRIAMYNSKETMELLLKQPGIDVNAKNKDGLTAYKWAVRYGYVDSVELLSKHSKKE